MSRCRRRRLHCGRLGERRWRRYKRPWMPRATPVGPGRSMYHRTKVGPTWPCPWGDAAKVRPFCERAMVRLTIVEMTRADRRGSGRQRTLRGAVRREARSWRATRLPPHATTRGQRGRRLVRSRKEGRRQEVGGMVVSEGVTRKGTAERQSRDEEVKAVPRGAATTRGRKERKDPPKA